MPKKERDDLQPIAPKVMARNSKRVTTPSGIVVPIKAAARGRKHSPTKESLSNLKPIQKGEVRNPWGPRGKTGTGGFSFVACWQSTLAKLGPEDREHLLLGLMRKVAEGDVPAIKLATELNLEIIGLAAQVSESIEDSGVRIVVNLPPKETYRPRPEQE